MILSGALIMLLFGCQSSLPDDVAKAYQGLPDQVDFNFHIKPILADRCYKCHGPDDNAREAAFRLDKEQAAFARLKEAGGHAFVKGNISKSVAWQRIISDDSERQMPPPTSNLNLSAREKALIGKWIRQGAEWKKHWAFIPPQKPEVPSSFSADWPANNSIDHFIQARLKEQDLKPSPQADKERLIRRLSFDLTGLPPSIEEIDEFLEDDSPQAYKNLVDRLLNTNAHAERMAMEWMDVARYADSHGLHADGLRSMWPWRDWVIDAFRKNMPYDDFVSWQIAGDLFPEATRAQKLATAFHRNHPINSEFGIVSEEFRLNYVADRTNTTATAFMGLTMECATCHDHKFDPISQKEYYQMSSFFNNVKELGMIGNDKNFGPLVQLPEPETEQALADLSEEMAHLSSQIELRKSEVMAIGNFIEEVKSNKANPPVPNGYFPLNTITEKKNKKGKTENILDNNQQARVTGEPELVAGKLGNAIRLDNDYDLIFLKGINHFNLDEPFSAGAWVKPEKEEGFQTIMGNMGGKNSGWRGWTFFLDSLNRPAVMLVHSLSHNYLHLTADASLEPEEWNQVFFTYDGSAKAEGLQVYINGKSIKSIVHFDQLYKSIKPVSGRNYVPDPNRQVMMGKGHNYLFTDTDNGIFRGSFDEIQFFPTDLTSLEVATLYNQNLPDNLRAKPLSKEEYLDHYLHRFDQKYQDLNKKLARLRQEKYRIMENVREVMVLEEMPVPRKTYLLERGQYDAPAEEVHPATPVAILPFTEQYPRNRLGLTQWLFNKDHPLTARVAVNRYWQMIFGQGIVSTPHDFGSQGALPSHPDLLDWLAVEFIESGWDVRALIRMMVTSATYRQSSIATSEQLSKDAQNIYLSRGGSYRLPWEMIRDNALAASGLLNDHIGGMSVKPYQPEGLWKEKNEFSGFLLTYQQDTGDSLYRRSLYTFIRRTSPPPTMTIFDVPARDVCTVKREKTSTPLQALVILNDPQFVEAARVLAERIQREGGEDLKERTQYAFRLLCGRAPTLKEMNLLEQQYDYAIDKYQRNPEAAVELLEVGDLPFDDRLDSVETAALAMVVNTMMNFDEAYMKR